MTKKDASSLAKKKCTPCKEGTGRLNEKQEEELLELLGHEWKISNEHHLEKTLHFPDFTNALAYTNIVGEIAEMEGHHPDIYLSWGKVKLTIWTHKVKGLTESDFILAAKCQEKFEHFHIVRPCF